MSDPLATYLHDHLAGSRVAIDLLGFMRDQHKGEPIGQFASELLAEIEKDRDVLKGLIQKLGASRSAVKEMLAWVGEKAARVKLHRKVGKDLGTLQVLETLALGVLGKRALWDALAAAASRDIRLMGPDYQQLAARAQAQHDQVEERRLEAARKVLPARHGE